MQHKQTHSAVPCTSKIHTHVDHETVGKLHGLRAGAAELPGDDALDALCAALHDEAEDAVAGAADGEAREQLVPEGLALGDGAQPAVLQLLGVQLHGVLREIEALLDERSELADPAAPLAEDLLRLGGADDDLRARGGHADLHAGIALLRELAREELIELGVEDAVRDKLLIFRRKAGEECCSGKSEKIKRPCPEEPPTPRSTVRFIGVIAG
ncbi:MAG: hypothetical protein BJ554DRAFT_7524, partial [Olpidium bornovanus]